MKCSTRFTFKTENAQNKSSNLGFVTSVPSLVSKERALCVKMSNEWSELKTPAHSLD